MSYILEALKKSEYEREHGGVPDLKADHQFNFIDDQKKPWWKYTFIFVISVILMLVAALIYTGKLSFVVGENQSGKNKIAIPDSVISNSVIQENDIVETPVRSVIPKVAKIPEPISMQDKPVISDSEMSSSKPVVPEYFEDLVEKQSTDSPVQNKEQTTTQARLGKNTLPAISSTSAKSAAIVVNKSPVIESKSDPREIVNISQLPDAIQKSLPDLEYSGHLYSSNPLRRKLIINDRSMKEGEWVSDGLQLDEITMGGAVFFYKGYYYRLELLRNWSAN